MFAKVLSSSKLYSQDELLASILSLRDLCRYFISYNPIGYASIPLPHIYFSLHKHFDTKPNQKPSLLSLFPLALLAVHVLNKTAGTPPSSQLEELLYSPSSDSVSDSV
jgi:hypothetical protein